MISALKYFSFFFLVLSTFIVLMILSFIAFGKPEINFNGVLLETSEQGIESLLKIILPWFIAGIIFFSLHKKLYEKLPQFKKFFIWAEELTTDNPKEHIKFYVSIFLLGIIVTLFLPELSIQERLKLISFIPVACISCWIFTWVAMGVSLINPIVWFIPWIMKLLTYLWHFMAVCSSIIGIAAAPFVTNRPENAVLAAGAGIGCAIAASQFYRFWVAKRVSENS